MHFKRLIKIDLWIIQEGDGTPDWIGCVIIPAYLASFSPASSEGSPRFLVSLFSTGKSSFSFYTRSLFPLLPFSLLFALFVWRGILSCHIFWLCFHFCGSQFRDNLAHPFLSSSFAAPRWTGLPRRHGKARLRAFCEASCPASGLSSSRPSDASKGSRSGACAEAMAHNPVWPWLTLSNGVF